jgi:hypothetical protein
LNVNFSKEDIEKIVSEIQKETNELQYQKKGKNIYITNNEQHIRVTINSNNYRIITLVDLVKYEQADHIKKIYRGRT